MRRDEVPRDGTRPHQRIISRSGMKRTKKEKETKKKINSFEFE